MKVYVVVAYGPAQDGLEMCIGALAAYSTLEKAQTWIWYQDSGPVSYDIEEHEVDEPPDCREG